MIDDTGNLTHYSPVLRSGALAPLSVESLVKATSQPIVSSRLIALREKRRDGTCLAQQPTKASRQASNRPNSASTAAGLQQESLTAGLHATSKGLFLLKLKRSLGTALMAAGLIIGTAAPAVAATVWSPGNEGKAYSNGDFVRVHDEEANGESVYSKYYIHGSNSENRIEVVTGNGTSNQTQDFSAGINKFNACNNNNNFPDDCSSSVNP